MSEWTEESAPGVSLEAFLDEHGTLAPEAALAVLKDLLLGHAAAHFGVTLPSIHNGQSDDPANDVYAATRVFFLCVTGSGQFTEPPVDQVPEPLRALVTRGMAKDAAHRPSSATAFAAELEAAAVAGYGEDWESKGRAQLAGTLPATRTGTRGVAAKIAAVVLGAAVVVSVTVLVLTNTGDSPAVTQEALSVSTRTERASYETNVEVTAELVQVSGVGNADAVNEALRAPVDARVRELREQLANVRRVRRENGYDRWDDEVTVTIRATVLLRTARHVSVRYENAPDASPISDSLWHSFDTVTVDLRTGTALPRDRVFRPGAPDALADVLLAHSPDRLCEGPGKSVGELLLFEEDLGDAVTVAFTPDHASFTIELPAFDRVSDCGVRTVDVPYADLTEVLDTSLVRELTTG